MAVTARWRNISINEFGWVGRLVLTQNGEAQDISSYTTLQFVLEHPASGTQRTVAAEFATDGTDGVLQHIIEDGDIDAAGTWEVYATIARTGASLRSSTHKFYVSA